MKLNKWQHSFLHEQLLSSTFPPTFQPFSPLHVIIYKSYVGTITQDDTVAPTTAHTGDGRRWKTHEPLENFNLLLHFQVLQFQHRNSFVRL